MVLIQTYTSRKKDQTNMPGMNDTMNMVHLDKIGNSTIYSLCHFSDHLDLPSCTGDEYDTTHSPYNCVKYVCGAMRLHRYKNKKKIAIIFVPVINAL